MERKFELTCKHTVWSIIGCPFSLCRRSMSAAPIQISGKWLFENFTPPDKRLKTVLELQVRYFHLANQLLWVDTSCSEQGMGKSWLRTGSGSRVAPEQALCLGKSSPQRRCVCRTEEHQNQSKTAEKIVYFDRVTFSLHSIYRKPRDWGLWATCRAPARIWLAVIDFQKSIWVR